MEPLIVFHNGMGNIELYPHPFSCGSSGKLFFSRCGKYVVKVPYNNDEIDQFIKTGYFVSIREFSSEIDYNVHELRKLSAEILELLICQQADYYKEIEDVDGYFDSFEAGLLNSTMQKVLILPRFNALPFSLLPLRICYSTLPAILSVLCRKSHGNLTPTNILIDKNMIRVHLIDPGVEITIGEWAVYNRSGSKRLKLFRTSTNYYPIIPPSFQLTRFIYDGFNFSKCLADAYHFHKPDLNTVYGKTLANGALPDIADMIALGIIFYEKATNKHPFQSLITKPFWEQHVRLGFAHHLDDDISRFFKKIQPPIELNKSITRDENDLILSLLNCNKDFEYFMTVSGSILKKYRNT